MTNDHEKQNTVALMLQKVNNKTIVLNKLLFYTKQIFIESILFVKFVCQLFLSLKKYLYCTTKKYKFISLASSHEDI